MLCGFGELAEGLLTLVDRDRGEQVVERDGHQLRLGHIAIDRLGTEWNQFHVRMDKARRDAIHACQLFDAAGLACGDLLVPAAGTSDDFENGLATRIRCEAGIAADEAYGAALPDVAEEAFDRIDW